MYKVRNKLTATIVAIALLFMLAVPMLVWQTTPVKAVTQETTSLRFANNTSSVDLLSTKGYKWENDAGNYKLTLSSFNQSVTIGNNVGITFASINTNVSIEIIGYNNINVAKNTSPNASLYGGIVSESGSISIEGAGTLTITVNGVDQNNGIYAKKDIDATNFTGEMIISVESNHDANNTSAITTSSGIKAGGALKIAGGNYIIKAVGGKTNNGLVSSLLPGGVFISGGIIDISAKKATKTDSNAYGINGYSEVTISGENTIVTIQSDNGAIYSSLSKMQFTDVHPLGKNDQYFDAELKQNTTNLVYKDSNAVAKGVHIMSKNHYAAQYTEAGHLSDCICTQESQTLPHTWNSGAITKAPTETGIKTFTCTLIDCARTRQETLPMLSGGGETTPPRLSIGAIAGITVGSVVVAGGGGFCLWWFLLLPFLRKRKEEKIEIIASQDSQENDKKD